ncbi:keratin, type II cytoskeletal 8-like isoform 2-T2 [Pholidichthys leucotaenia]
MSKDYSSQTYSPGSQGPRKSVPYNRTDSSSKSREKDDMVGLNDKFVQLIEKVKDLEDEKKKLDTKLKILKEQEEYSGKVDDIVKQLEDELEQKVYSLLRDQEKLKEELLQNRKEVDDTKKKYEDEVSKKDDLEKEFIVTKKDVDESQLLAVDLALELEDMMEKLEFLRVGYDEEIKELESRIQNGTVVIREKSKRSLDMDHFIESVKNQYASISARSREEVEQWNQRKMDVLVQNAGQHEEKVRDLRREISDMTRHIQRLKGELDALKRKEDHLKKDMDDLRKDGDEKLNHAREDIAQLDEALRRAKQDLAGQIHDHQALMNIKMGQDIEIATYRKLLEGEEQRMDNLLRPADF